LLSSGEERIGGGLRPVFRRTGVFSDILPKLVDSDIAISNGSGVVKLVPKDEEDSQFSPWNGCHTLFIFAAPVLTLDSTGNVAFISSGLQAVSCVPSGDCLAGSAVSSTTGVRGSHLAELMVLLVRLGTAPFVEFTLPDASSENLILAISGAAASDV
jgi:hypothetical protein